jgi:hypothetical protein
VVKTATQAEKDRALVEECLAIACPLERRVWYQANGPAFTRAVGRIKASAAETTAAAYATASRAAERVARLAVEEDLAKQFKAITNNLARRDFAQRHPTIASRVSRGEL